MSEKYPPEDFMFAPRCRYYVYRLPAKLTQDYCFDGGHPIEFLNIDWFDASSERKDQASLIDYLKKKQYYDPTKHYLILAAEPDLTFTIEPSR